MKSDSPGGQSQFLWEVCGHEKVVSYLKSSILNRKISHAYIFAGPEHLGKHTVALKFIKTLYCQGQGDYRPCGDCPACRQVESGTHPDIYRLKKIINEKTGKWRQEIIIDQIRELKIQLSQGTLLKSWKVAIIDEAETLNENAANSLLKVLEEPTPQTVIILIASDISRLPQTILSRSLILNFLPVPREDISDCLLSRGLSQDKAERITRLSLGRPGAAINLAEDNELFLETKKQSADFIKLLTENLAGRLKNLANIIDWEKDEALNIIKLNQLLNNWQMALRDILLVKNFNEANLAELKPDKELKNLRQLSWLMLIKADWFISQARQAPDYNFTSKNILENLVINL